LLLSRSIGIALFSVLIAIELITVAVMAMLILAGKGMENKRNFED
jgi:hypothetical protein